MLIIIERFRCTITNDSYYLDCCYLKHLRKSLKHQISLLATTIVLTCKEPYCSSPPTIKANHDKNIFSLSLCLSLAITVWLRACFCITAALSCCLIRRHPAARRVLHARDHPGHQEGFLSVGWIGIRYFLSFVRFFLFFFFLKFPVISY